MLTTLKLFLQPMLQEPDGSVSGDAKLKWRHVTYSHRGGPFLCFHDLFPTFGDLETCSWFHPPLFLT